MEVLTTLDERRLEHLIADPQPFWLDLTDPDPETVRALGRALDLHPLAVEDTLEFDQRPKLDRYDDVALLVFYGVEQPPEPAAAVPEAHEPQAIEVHFYVSERGLVSVHRQPAPQLELALAEAEALGPDQGYRALLFALDALADSFFPLLEATAQEAERTEDEALRDPEAEQLEVLTQLRRRTAELRRIANPQRDMFRRAGEHLVGLRWMPPDVGDYLRDTQDAMDRVADGVEATRDLVASATDVYFTSVSNRLNQTGERLTLVATILLPLTLITGFFGMNFDWLVTHVETLGDFLVYGIGSMVVSVILAGLYVHRTRS